VATVSATGLLTVVDAGSADVSGTYSGFSASTRLTALFPAPPSAVLSISVGGQDEQRGGLAVSATSNTRLEFIVHGGFARTDTVNIVFFYYGIY
jgi:hypothetical protein